MSGDERERAILRAAQTLLASHSLHEISVDDIARTAGISRPTFYFYFQSKEAVLLSLLDRMVSDARRKRDAAVVEAGEQNIVGGWRAGMESFFATWAANRDLVRAGDAARATSGEVRRLWARVTEELVEDTAAAIETERARGAAPAGLPSRELAVALIRMNERVFATTFSGETPALAESRALDTVLTIWLAAIYGSNYPGPLRGAARER
jgi:AcrR family transcriptional regulator